MTPLADRDRLPGDLDENQPRPAPWTDPDHPAPALDAANCGGIIPPTQRGTNDGWDSITVLHARSRRLAKLIASDSTITDYDNAKHFDMTEIPVDGIDHLEEDLRRLLHQPDRGIVRGRIANPGRVAGVRRLLHAEGSHPATLVDAPRSWVALDIDRLTRPANVEAADLVACAGIAIAALPAEFHKARGLVQATASHGVKPGLRLRLWFWLSRPVSTAKLKRWLPPEAVDHALFSAVQIIYTAAPVFAARRDPLPARLVKLPHGTACVSVPTIPEAEPPPLPPPVRPATGLSRYAEVTLDNAWRRIANAQKGERDRTVNGVSYALGRLAAAGVFPTHFALGVLHHATAQIPGYNARRDGSKVDRSFADGLRNPREVNQ